MFEGDEDSVSQAGRRLKDEALARREAQIDALLETVPDPLYAVDQDWRITLMNRPAAAFFQRDRAELVGRVMWEVFPEVLGTEIERRMRAAMDGEGRISFESESTTRPGRFVNLHITKKATGGLAFMFADITEQRAAQQRERRQAEEFRALADNMPALCWMAYADGRIYWYNSRWYEYTGMALDAPLDRGWETAHDPAVLPLVTERWEASLRDGRPFEMVHPLKGRDGGFRPFLSRIVPIRDDTGSVTRWFGSSTEIAAQVRQQQRLQSMVDELNHRVKNTLATIQSIASNSLRRAADVDSGYRAFEGRLMALSAAHNVLSNGAWEGADLRTLLLATTEPFARMRDGRVALDGPEVWLCPATALALSLVIHELGVNATRYGGLSDDGGAVALTWSLAQPDRERRLVLHWVERGGPVVRPPAATGFGSRLIEQILRAERGGATFDFAPAGLACTLTLPLTPQGPALDLQQPPAPGAA